MKINPCWYLNKTYSLYKEKRLLPVLRYYLQELVKQEETLVRLSERLSELNRNKLSQISIIKQKLFSLGFHEQAYKELNTLVNSTEPECVKIKAAWVLAQWHADLDTAEDYNECLKFIGTIESLYRNRSISQNIAIVKAEALCALNKNQEARETLLPFMRRPKDTNVFLAMANLEKDLDQKTHFINQALIFHNLSAISLSEENERICFNPVRLDKAYDRNGASCSKPLVSVIMPAYNAANTIHIALTSLINQTWANLEIIVVDDASTDNTVNIVEKFIRKDSRIQLIKCSINQGTYVSRNIGLQKTKGVFITCHDTDDWSHPDKIGSQAMHLINNRGILANTSELVRVSDSLKFVRRGNPGFFIQKNLSSLMLRRGFIETELGNWDSVRFAADGEMVNRIHSYFGLKSIKHLKTGPMSFAYQGNHNLTSTPVFGYPGFFFGARKEYKESFSHYFTKAENTYCHFPQESRQFPVPYPMLPQRKKPESSLRHFDVVIASEFRLPGDTTKSILEEIKAQKSVGVSTGLVQLNRYDVDSVNSINSKIREQLDQNLVQMLVYGENISCDLLIIRHPPVLQYWQKYIPAIRAVKIIVVANQTPLRDYSGSGERIYDVTGCMNNLYRYFHKEATWYPIGPLVREKLLLEKEFRNKSVELAPVDWVNLINTDEWMFNKKFRRNQKVTIGRHGRDSYVKWPDDKETLIKIYPVNSDKVEVKILGGAAVPLKMLRKKPENWTIYPFDSIKPNDFLAELDVFVYFHHSSCTEAFGRTILEAMAAGVPVILPHHFKALFEDAAIYATPDEVMGKITELMSDSEYYQSRSDKGVKFVSRKYGYERHIERIRPYVKSLQ